MTPAMIAWEYEQARDAVHAAQARLQAAQERLARAADALLHYYEDRLPAKTEKGNTK